MPLHTSALEEAKLTPLVNPQGPALAVFSFQISQRIPVIQCPCLSLNYNLHFSFDTCLPPSSSFVCLASNANHPEDTEVLLPLCKVSTCWIKSTVYLLSKADHHQNQPLSERKILSLFQTYVPVTLHLRDVSAKTASRNTPVQNVC